MPIELELNIEEEASLQVYLCMVVGAGVACEKYFPET